MIGIITSFIYIIIISAFITAFFHLPVVGGILVLVLSTLFMFCIVNDKLQKISVVNTAVNFGLSYAACAGVSFYIHKYFELPVRALLLISFLWGCIHIVKTLLLDEWIISGKTTPGYLFAGAIYSAAVCYTLNGFDVDLKLMVLTTIVGAIGFVVYRNITAKSSGKALYIKRFNLLIEKLDTLCRLTEDPDILRKATQLKEDISYYIVHHDETDELEEYYRKASDQISQLLYEHIRTHDIGKSAPELKFFSGCDTKPEIRKRYHELSKQYHPDTPGGDAGLFEEMSREYKEVIGQF